MDRDERGHVIRAQTPPRGPIDTEAREALWTLSPPSGEPIIRADLVALADAAELETFCSGKFRRRRRYPSGRWRAPLR